MPQLNPAPWLMIFLLTWIIFLFVYTGKAYNSYYPNMPTQEATTTQDPLNWNWPWH